MLDPNATVWICKKCRKDFISEKKLREHSEVHVGKHNIQCSICKKYFEHGWQYEIHKKEMHEDV